MTSSYELGFSSAGCMYINSKNERTSVMKTQEKDKKMDIYIECESGQNTRQ